MANQTSFNYGMNLGGKTLPGKILIDYDNGNAEWFRLGTSYPTFSSSKDTGGSGKWGWTPSASDSISNLRRDLPVGLDYNSDDALIKDFYTGDSIPGLNNQRAYAFNKNAPQTGRNLGLPGVRGTSSTPGVQPQQPSDPVTPGQQPAATPTPDGPSSSPTTVGAKPKTDQSANTSVIATYPLGMDTTQQDRIKFTALEYIPSGSLSGGTIAIQNRSNLSGKKPLGHVFLPIQATITDTNSVDWQGSSLNEIDRSLVNLSSNVMNASTKSALDTALGSAGTKAIDKIIGSSNEIKVALAGEAAGVQNLLGRFGTILNPNLELLFTGPQLRPFDFRFQLSARQKDEADNIKKIINFFKKNMAARKGDNSIFLRSPNTFLIEYKYKGSETEHPGIGKIKECALLNCSVDYTPLGTYMTYDDGTMVSYAITLSFQELEPIYDDDYTGHSIGY